jgi:hypothetical protein
MKAANMTIYTDISLFQSVLAALTFQWAPVVVGCLILVLWALVGGFLRELTLFIGEVYKRYVWEWFESLRGRRWWRKPDMG